MLAKFTYLHRAKRKQTWYTFCARGGELHMTLHEHHGILNHCQHYHLFNSFLRITTNIASLAHCEGNLLKTGGIHSQRVSNAESVSMSWCNHGKCQSPVFPSTSSYCFVSDSIPLSKHYMWELVFINKVFHLHNRCCSLSPKTHFTKGLGAQNPNLVKHHVAFTLRIMTQSCHNFACITTA